VRVATARVGVGDDALGSTINEPEFYFLNHACMWRGHGAMAMAATRHTHTLGTAGLEPDDGQQPVLCALCVVLLYYTTTRAPHQIKKCRGRGIEC